MRTRQAFGFALGMSFLLGCGADSGGTPTLGVGGAANEDTVESNGAGGSAANVAAGGDGNANTSGRAGAGPDGGRDALVTDARNSGGGSNDAGGKEGASSASGPKADGSTGSAGGSSGKKIRPTYNTGTGFFTADGKLYDANGVEFHPVGFNTLHYDANWASCTSNCGIPNTHANTVRMGLPLWSAIPASTLQNLMNKMIGGHIVPIAGVWYVDGSYADSSNVTCKNDSGSGSGFAAAVSQWVARAALFKPFEKYMLLNIANEWGPSNGVGWRDAYISAVATLRQAGYLCTLVIDGGGCGQDVNDIVKYAQAIYDSDPQHNIVFDSHIYGMWATQTTGEQSWQTDLTAGFDQMKATGLPILIGEFGPGKNLGPSPTPITPASIIQAANAHGFGWLAWAWDDGYGSGFALSNQGFFSSSNGAYPNNADLTGYGNEIVLNPSFGTFTKAIPATVF